MAKSEIDDIFASVGGESSKDKSKKSKTGKTSKIESTKPNDEKKNANVSDIQPKAKTKRKAPETVVDPSKALESAASTSAKKQKKGKSTSKNGVSVEDEEFRDSRGINSESRLRNWIVDCVVF